MHARDHISDTHFVGDSMTAEAIDEFGKRMDEGFADIRAQIRHLGRHSSVTPVPGCEYCEGTHAA